MTFLCKISQLLSVGNEAIRSTIQSPELRLEIEMNRIHVGGDWRLRLMTREGWMCKEERSGASPTGTPALQDWAVEEGSEAYGAGEGGMELGWGPVRRGNLHTP